MRSGRKDKILEKYRDVFEMLEEYDRTHELPFQTKRNFQKKEISLASQNRYELKTVL